MVTDTIRSALLIFLLYSSLAAAAPPQTTTGAIEGTVVHADTGEPASGAQVLLATVPQVPAEMGFFLGTPVAGAGGRGGPPSPTVPPFITKADGKFSFANLAPGSYRLAATADGFMRQEYGSRVANGAARLLFVNAGQSVRDLSLRLIATGKVTGRVSNEMGNPVANIPIRVFRITNNALGPVYQIAGTANTDDRGTYRVFGVAPGRYYILAGASPDGSPPRGQPGTVVRYRLSYYPGVVDFTQAVALDIGSGSEAAADLTLRPLQETYRVRGRVIESAVGPNTSIQLNYRLLSETGALTDRTLDPATGGFEFRNVPPGEYTVHATIATVVPPPAALDAAGNATLQAARASQPSMGRTIRVSDADIEGIVLAPISGVSAEGRIAVEGQSFSSLPNKERMRVSVAAPEIRTPQTPVAVSPIGTEGAFQVVGLREDQYQVLLAGIPAGFYLETFRYKDQNLLSQPFNFAGVDSGAFQIVLRPGTAQISGSVNDARGFPVSGVLVVLVPDQRSRIEPYYRLAFTDQTGRYAMSSVPPGTYRVYSWESVETNAYYDAGFLAGYQERGTPVRVQEASNLIADVRLIPVP